MRSGDWAGALALADGGAPRAALATAAANATQDPGAALKLAEVAWKADPRLAPAALAYAWRPSAAGKERRGAGGDPAKLARALHPDLAAFALVEAGEPLKRIQAAQRLTEANPDHVESRLLLARAALTAGLTGEARRQAEGARAAGLDQRRVWLLLAEIEGDGDGWAAGVAACAGGGAGSHLAVVVLSFGAGGLAAGVSGLRDGGRTAVASTSIP